MLVWNKELQLKEFNECEASLRHFPRPILPFFRENTGKIYPLVAGVCELECSMSFLQNISFPLIFEYLFRIGFFIFRAYFQSSLNGVMLLMNSCFSRVYYVYFDSHTTLKYFAQGKLWREYRLYIVMSVTFIS